MKVRQSTYRDDSLLFTARKKCLLLLKLSLFLGLLPTFTNAKQSDYRIDPATSQASFQVRRLWVNNITGKFTQITGDVVAHQPDHSWIVNATITLESVRLSSKRMRQRILAPPFFDAQRYPQIHFVSNPIAQFELDNGGILTGHLTLRGITAPMQFTLKPVSCERSAQVPCRITLQGKLKRSTFGMTSHRLTLSDDIDLNLNITLQHTSR